MLQDFKTFDYDFNGENREKLGTHVEACWTEQGRKVIFCAMKKDPQVFPTSSLS